MSNVEARVSGECCGGEENVRKDHEFEAGNQRGNVEYCQPTSWMSKETEEFWSMLNEVVEHVLRGKRLVIGVDFNRHLGEGNRGDENLLGNYCVKGSNAERQTVMDFAKRMEMALMNTYCRIEKKHWMLFMVLKGK